MEIKIINKIIQYSFVLMFVLLGCVDNKTVHNLIELNEVSINGMDKNGYEALLGEDFVIDPKITTLHNDESQLTYLWYYYQRFSPYLSDTISNEKILHYKFDNMVIGGKYSLTLKVIDEASNVFYQQTVDLTAINKYSKGSMLLCKTNEKFDLSLLNIENDYFLNNIYSKENESQQLDLSSSKLYCISPYAQNIDAYKAILVLSEDGGSYINTSTIKDISSLKNKINTSHYGCSYYCASQTSDFLICNGKLHIRKGDISVPIANWGKEIVMNNQKSDYFLASSSLHPGYAEPLFYDNLNNRFVKFHDEGFIFFSGSEHKMTAFDGNDVGENMVLLSSGYFSSNDEMWALMQNEISKKFYVLRFNLNDGVFTAEVKQEISEQEAPNLKDAIAFNSLSHIYILHESPWTIRVDGIPGMLTYIANNNVYALNMNSSIGEKAENKLVDGNTFNINMTNLFSRVTLKKSDLDLETYTTRLELCVKDRSIDKMQGGVLYFNLNSIGGLKANLTYKKTGFCDEVLWLDEKYN